jgi:hypothetical protein
MRHACCSCKPRGCKGFERYIDRGYCCPQSRGSVNGCWCERGWLERAPRSTCSTCPSCCACYIRGFGQ